MTDSIRPLPMFWREGYEPTSEDWAAVREAKRRTGYSGLVVPRRAAYGSPGVILAVGALPDWLCRFAYVDGTRDIEKLTEAMNIVLNDPEDPSVGTEADLLSRWMGVPVRAVGLERDDEELL